jgi:tetratricopeptide (TPR) repeat protein
MVLLGDLAENTERALSSYGDALQCLLEDPDQPLDIPLALSPGHWSIGYLDSGRNGSAEPVQTLGPHNEGERPPLVIAYQDDDQDWTWEEPDRYTALIWGRIAEAEERRGHLGDAYAWLALAESLFAARGDIEGYQLVKSAQQRLAARHSDIGQLEELIESQEGMLSWARSNGAVELELQTLLDLADARLRLNHLELARDRYREAEETAQRFGDSFRQGLATEGMARVAISQGRFQDADRQLATARTLYESGSTAEARQLDLLTGDRWLTSKDYERARAAFERVLDWATIHDEPDSVVRARLGLARTARTEFDLEEAAQQLEAATALGSRVDPILELDVLMDWAMVLRMQHADLAAKALEERAEAQATRLSLEPLLAGLLRSRGETALRRGELKDAVTAYTQALARFESLKNEEGILYSLIGLAGALSDAGKPEEALSAARRAERTATEAALAAWRDDAEQAVGMALVNSRRAEEALAYLLAPNRQRPDDPRFCTNLGWVCLRSDRFEPSIEWSRRAIELAPGDAFPYRNLGHALLALGRLDEAREAYAKAIAGRFADENFRNTLVELDVLGRRHPGLPGLSETVTWFRSEQQKLDASESLDPPPR